MKNLKKLCYALNLFLLSLVIISCEGEEVPTAEDLNTDCGTDVVSAISDRKTIDEKVTAVVRLFSGGHTKTVRQFLYGRPSSFTYTALDSIFNHDFVINFDYEIYNKSTEATINQGEATFSVQKGDPSEVTIPFYAYSSEEDEINFLEYGHRISNIRLEYQSECPELADGETIDDNDVEEAITSDETFPLPVLGTLKNKTSNTFTITENGIIVPEGKTISSFGLFYRTEDSEVNIPSTGDVNGFELEVTDLKDATRYLVLAYAVMDDSTFYSNNFLVVETDAIEIVVPTVTVGSEITAKSANSFTIAGNIVNGGTPAPTEFGIAYATTNNPANSQKISAEGNPSGYEVNVMGLAPETTYYVWAYAMQNGNTLYSDTSTEVTTDAAASTVIFNGDTYTIDGSSWNSFTPDQILFTMNQDADGYQDFNININLNATGEAGIISGTYTFNGSELSFDNFTTIGLTNSNFETTFYEATGGTIILTIEDNGDYTVEMDFTTTGGPVTGTYTIPLEY